MLNASEEFILPSPLSEPDTATCRELARELQVPEIIATLLYQRGVATADAARDFLSPKLADLPSPATLKGMPAAVELLTHSVVSGEQVVIHGDYDVDGITATVLLADFLEKLGVQAITHLPNRLTDDYGLTMRSVAALAKKVTMPALLITVDCGISTAEEVRYAKEMGFRVIITDHHNPPGNLKKIPKADAVINPKQPGCEIVYKDLCGVGVVFFLLMAMRRKMVEKGVWTESTMPNLRDSLDLVALGTVADVMRLTEVNRILVRAGLEVISERCRPGIRALCAQTGMKEGFISAENIAYQLAPRINATGRLGTPQLAADLLLSKQSTSAAELAKKLDQANVLRRELEAAVLDEAVRQAEKQVSECKVSLVLYGKDWHLGVIGIIASRMVDRFQLPTLVFTGDNQPYTDAQGTVHIIKGSGRSIDGLNLHQVLEQCHSKIIRFGGHAMAAGLSIREKEFDEFRAIFDNCVRNTKREEQQPGIMVDAVLTDQEDCRNLIRGLQRMEPFGEGNPEPIFLLKGIQLEQVQRLREHLKFSLRINGSPINGIGFFMADEYIEAASGTVDFGFKLKETCFRGRKRIEAYAVGLFPSS
ncbi:MAG: single-stranded-DNA-specific exonuclease RecJ [Candidatus Electrothrix sp. AR4]|nr:single-stranded-DNA-specific exonuclease RecJ [Candidatus Electrothrix sp. AR4]